MQDVGAISVATEALRIGQAKNFPHQVEWKGQGDSWKPGESDWGRCEWKWWKSKTNRVKFGR